MQNFVLMVYGWPLTIVKQLILFDDYQCSGRSIDPSDGSAVSHRSRALIGDKKSQKLQDNILKDVNAHD